MALTTKAMAGEVNKSAEAPKDYEVIVSPEGKRSVRKIHAKKEVKKVEKKEEPKELPKVEE